MTATRTERDSMGELEVPSSALYGAQTQRAVNNFPISGQRFGRRFIDVDPEELAADVLYQLAALDGLARAVGSAVTYLKPHGALYHAVAEHEGQARAVVEALLAWTDAGLGAREPLPLLHQAGSLVTRLAQDSSEIGGESAVAFPRDTLLRHVPVAILPFPKKVSVSGRWRARRHQPD